MWIVGLLAIGASVGMSFWGSNEAKRAQKKLVQTQLVGQAILNAQYTALIRDAAVAGAIGLCIFGAVKAVQMSVEA
jgi:hypothetical protein